MALPSSLFSVVVAAVTANELAKIAVANVLTINLFMVKLLIVYKLI
jgi:hypothetical protein